MDLRTNYGAPISRRRLYLLMVEESAMTDEALRMDFSDFIQQKLKAMHLGPCKVQWLLILINEGWNEYHANSFL
jgi:hypothetical protein